MPRAHAHTHTGHSHPFYPLTPQKKSPISTAVLARVVVLGRVALLCHALSAPAGAAALLQLIARHLVRGEPLPRLHRGLLPEGLARRVAMGVELRPYQWEGVAWLDFLRCEAAPP